MNPTTKKKYSPIPNDNPGGGGGGIGGGTACPTICSETNNTATTKNLFLFLIYYDRFNLLTQLFLISHIRL